MSNKNSLRFVSLGVNAFSGLTPKTKVEITYPEGFDISQELNDVEKENGLVIVFPNGYNYVEVEGDQGTGKTSLIECLKEACGGLAIESTVNKDLNDKNYRDRFYGVDGKLYSFKVTKSTVTLERFELDEEGNIILDAKGRETKVIINSPKAMLAKIIGPSGVSPMSLKEMNGQEQVKWLRSLYNLDLDAETFEYQLKQKYDKAFKERTAANAQHARLATLVTNNVYYKEYPKWDKYFQEVKYEDLQGSVADVQKKFNDYQKAKDGIPQLIKLKVNLNEDAELLRQEILALQNRLTKKEEAITETEERIKKGEEYLTANISIEKEHTDLADKINEAGTYKQKEEQWKQMLLNKSEWDKAADEKIRLDGLVAELAKSKKEYIKTFAPEIEGFEVCIPNEEDTREGIFYNKKSLSILAESELWELATQIWKDRNVKIIYVDNITNLGTGAVERFNEFLSNDGAYIFGTKMNRGEKNLKISFHNKIPI